ncbi:MAG: hypothetical protein JWP27_1464 [Flaviaesturariibacter sp.]|nr:hypothetical protein [Flaviaesturariibacter sp.]
MQTGSYILPHRVLFNRWLALLSWFLLSTVGALTHLSSGTFNNFRVFRSVFFHALQGTSLYAAYPAEHADINLYGPVFSLVIAPFALLPPQVGAMVWVLANAALLLYAITTLPVPRAWQVAIVLLCAHELMINSTWFQSNALVASCLLLGYSFTRREREWAALFFIMLATFFKVYGIVGLCFFAFSPHKARFLAWAVIWSAVLFLAPALLMGINGLLRAYPEWARTLAEKSARNTGPGNLYQNVSVMGMAHRIFGLEALGDLWILAPAGLLFLSQFAQRRYLPDLRLQLYILASLLISVVIFSNGAESPTYIIAVPGICLWYILQPPSRRVNLFFGVVLILTTFAYSDLLGSWVRSHLMRPYSLKALAPFATWLVILVQVHRRQFLLANLPQDPERLQRAIA